MFVWVYLQMVAPKTRTGQEASPWVTEGLTLAKYRSLLKADAFTFRYFGGCESTKFILVDELRSVLSLFWSWEMTPESLMSPPFGSHTFSFLTSWGKSHCHGFLWKK